MHVVSVYNNKGGVGKSTLTVGLAEFLASNAKKRVLVIDLDAQASSSGSILGRRPLADAIKNERTIAQLAAKIRRRRKPLASLEEFLVVRPAAEVRGTALAEISVLVPDKSGIRELEDKMSRAGEAQILKKYLKPALSEFDYVLIDMPGHVDDRNTLIVNALTMSDFVLIPVEPTQMALSGLPDSFELVNYAREKNRDDRPAIVGMVLNKTDRRVQQYKSKFPQILRSADQRELPPIFNNLLPESPKLATATDETRQFLTLKDRFDSYYLNVRKVAKELEKRCEEFQFHSENHSAGFAVRFRKLLDSFVGR